MPIIYLSPSTQENNFYVSGGSEEYWMNRLADAMVPYLNATVQTAVSAGITPAAFRKALDDNGCHWIDRIVVPGEALQFDTIWDRKDLLLLLSKHS